MTVTEIEIAKQNLQVYLISIEMSLSVTAKGF